MINCKIIILVCIVIILVNLIISIFNQKNTENFTIDPLNNNLEKTQSYVLYIPKREKYIKDVMEKIGVDAKYILGPPKEKVDRVKLLADGMLSKKYYDMNKKEEKGEVAVFLGHVSILKKFLNQIINMLLYLKMIYFYQKK